MIFLNDLGVKMDAKFTKKQKERLTDLCESFLRGGGGIGELQWLSLTEPERTALREAGNRIRIDDAQTIAEAVVTRLIGNEEDLIMARLRDNAGKRAKKGAA